MNHHSPAQSSAERDFLILQGGPPDCIGYWTHIIINPIIIFIYFFFIYVFYFNIDVILRINMLAKIMNLLLKISQT